MRVTGSRLTLTTATNRQSAVSPAVADASLRKREQPRSVIHRRPGHLRAEQDRTTHTATVYSQLCHHARRALSGRLNLGTRFTEIGVCPKSCEICCPVHLGKFNNIFFPKKKDFLMSPEKKDFLTSTNEQNLIVHNGGTGHAGVS